MAPKVCSALTVLEGSLFYFKVTAFKINLVVSGTRPGSEITHFANKSYPGSHWTPNTKHSSYSSVSPNFNCLGSTLSPKKLAPKTQLETARQFEDFGKSMDKCSYYNSSKH